MLDSTCFELDQFQFLFQFLFYLVKPTNNLRRLKFSGLLVLYGLILIIILFLVFAFGFGFCVWFWFLRLVLVFAFGFSFNNSTFKFNKQTRHCSYTIYTTPHLDKHLILSILFLQLGVLGLKQHHQPKQLIHHLVWHITQVYKVPILIFSKQIRCLGVKHAQYVKSVVLV